MKKFTEFRNRLNENFNKLASENDYLFEVNLNKDELYDLYLNSFPKGTNPIFRERTEHDCSCCRSFIKRLGNAVFIIDNKIKTIWDFDAQNEIYQPVIDALDKYVKSHAVTSIYLVKKEDRLIGVEQNRDDKQIEILWDHFYLKLPEKYTYHGYKTLDTIKGDYKSSKDVLKRGLEEITKDSIETVLELISQNSLYKGNEWENQLKAFLELKNQFEQLETDEEKDNFCWISSLKVGSVVAKIKNHSIGVLLTNISNNNPLDDAVKEYERIVAPSNYKRSKPIFTKRMLDEAKKKIEQLGYMDSLQRRFATLDDISVNNILFANRDVYSKLNQGDIFDEMIKDIPEDIKKYSRVQETTANDFVNNVLPNAQEVNVMFENRLTSNLCSLITSQNKDSKSMFKWNNNFSWAYTGNITDSMKERVKELGGKVDGDLRFSIQWNEVGKDNYDLDAHCIERPEDGRNYEIYFGNKRIYSPSKGMLDVDIIQPHNEIAVENITYVNRKNMKPGVYEFYVHQFGGANKNGFRAEIEFDGSIYSYDYSKSMKCDERVKVAKVVLDDNGNFFIIEQLKSSQSTKEVWNVKTNQFIPVQTIMYSPNYWDEQNGVGNKHLFFMLKDCVNPETPNSFYNEFLNHELNENRKVMEALGSKLAVVDAQNQLSGLGFSLTQRNEVLVKVKTNHVESVMKVKF